MAINKKLIHFNNFSNFNSKKLSANIENTKYTIGIEGSILNGEPEILYQSIVYIKDTRQLWTHGQLYESNANVNYITTNFVDKTTNLSISGTKTFTNHINLNNKSRIRSNIDPGELKVTKTDTDQGFIVRVDTDSQDSILPLEILTTDGSASYKYNFPKTSGNIALGVKKAGQILETDLSDGLIDLGDNCLRVTYSNLKSLRDNGNLIPGLKYRITDYKATTQGLSGISVADHSFDIIVEALTQNTLSESAKAAKSDNILGTKQQDLFSWDMNPGNWIKTTNAEIQLLTDGTIYYQQGTRDVNLAGVIKVTFTPIVEDPETNDICIGVDLVKNGSVVSKDYHIGRINYDPYQADNNVYYLPVSGPGSYVIRYYVAGSSSNFETNLRITAEAYNGVGYFSTCNLNAWDIKYCLDCDTNRFQWVNINPFETKGVIYYMKDDHGNEAPYDFKNILFNGYYTFSYIQSTNNILDASVALNTCYLNVIKECYSTSNILKLNNIVFKITNSSSICGFNYFEGNCESIEFGDNCCSNKFGSYCKNNSFGDSCSYNTFADYCANNSFMNFCQSNNFGVYCQNNSFDSYIIRVTFGKQCINNKFTNNSLGDNLLEACRMIKFGDQCNGVNLYTTFVPSYSSGKWMQNITLSNALSGNIEITELNNDRTLFITKDSNSSIVKYFESDFINKQDTITDLEVIRQGAAKGATALQSYTEQYKGTVTSITINGSSKSPSNGIVDLGTVITAHQDISGKQDTLVSGTNIKTINGESILGEGNITIEGGSSDTYYLELPLGEYGQCLSSGTITQEQFEEMISCKTLIVRTSNMSSDGISASEDIAFDWRLTLIEQSDIGGMKGIVCSNIYPNPFNNCLTLYIFIFSSNGSECVYELIAKLIFLGSDIFDPTAVDLSDSGTYELDISANTESGEISEEEFNKIVASKSLILNTGMHKIACIQRTAPEAYPDTYYFYGNFFDSAELKIILSLLRRDGICIYTIQTEALSSTATQNKDGLMLSSDKKKLDELNQSTITNSRDTSQALKLWTGTESDYDNVSTKDTNTIYIII